GDYTWSLIKGDKGDKGDTGNQGIQGPPGADGTPRYTWIKYADSPTTGMSDSPAGKAYIGFAHNKTTATESSSYSDYTWSLIQGRAGSDGADGRGIESVPPYFRTTAIGASAPAKPTTLTPASPWTKTEPGYVSDTSLWRTDRIVYDNSTFAYTDVTK